MIEAWGTETTPVVVERPAERLQAGRLLANAERDERGELIVTTVSASDRVSVSREDGIEARAGRMEADGREERADFFDDVVLSRRGGGDDAVIRGDQVRVGGEDRVIEVFGEGDLQFARAAGENGEPGLLTVTWTKEMRFNDARGVIDSLGDVVATNRVGPLAVDVLRSNRVVVQLEPKPAEPDSADVGDAAVALEGRQVRRIEAIGESMEVAGGAEATAELRRYVEDADAEDGRKLERFARLTGNRIIASEVEGTLAVPGPGTAATYDARATAAAEEGETAGGGNVAPGLLPGGGGGEVRGATLFRWDGALSGDRTEGTLIMKRGVEMVHKPLEPQRPEVLMVCEELQTWIEEGPSEDSTSAAEGSRLSRIEAEGAVYVRADRPGTTERKELIADQLFYDAAAGSLLASARQGNQVKLFDVMRGAPVVARELEWDLVRDAIRVKEMSGSAVR